MRCLINNIIRKRFSTQTSDVYARYSKTHEYVKYEFEEGLKAGTIGISKYVANQLGEITFLEIKGEGEFVEKNQIFAIIETKKTVIELYAPLNGVILEQNIYAVSSPNVIKESPLDKGWLIKLACECKKDDGLMDNDAYLKYIATTDSSRSNN
jgi:glycine cleavage system H protein